MEIRPTLLVPKTRNATRNYDAMTAKEDGPMNKRQRVLESFVSRLSKKTSMTVHDVYYACFEKDQS